MAYGRDGSQSALIQRFPVTTWQDETHWPGPAYDFQYVTEMVSGLMDVDRNPDQLYQYVVTEDYLTAVDKIPGFGEMLVIDGEPKGIVYAVEYSSGPQTSCLFLVQKY